MFGLFLTAKIAVVRDSSNEYPHQMLFVEEQEKCQRGAPLTRGRPPD